MKVVTVVIVVTVVTVVTDVTKKLKFYNNKKNIKKNIHETNIRKILFHKHKNTTKFSFKNTAFTKKKLQQKLKFTTKKVVSLNNILGKTQKLKLWQQQKKLNLWQNSKTQLLQKKSDCEKAKTRKLWQNSNSNILLKQQTQTSKL